jgi:hypothetical protein
MDHEMGYKYRILQASLPGEDVNWVAKSYKISYQSKNWHGRDADLLNFKKKPALDIKPGIGYQNST